MANIFKERPTGILFLSFRINKTKKISRTPAKVWKLNVFFFFLYLMKQNYKILLIFWICSDLQILSLKNEFLCFTQMLHCWGIFLIKQKSSFCGPRPFTTCWFVSMWQIVWTYLLSTNRCDDFWMNRQVLFTFQVFKIPLIYIFLIL